LKENTISEYLKLLETIEQFTIDLDSDKIKRVEEGS
jgi:hypothetical protein